MRRLVLVLIFIFSCFYVIGQNQEQYNHYIANQGLLNPAYNGTREFMSGLLVSRNQWIGIEGAPITQALNVHSPISNTNLGLGLAVTNESMGAHHSLDCYGAVAYKVPINNDYKLSLGLQLGFNSFSMDQSKLVSYDNSDASLYDIPNTIALNVGFGSYFYSDKLFVGFSIPEFFTNFSNSKLGTDKSVFDYKNLHYYLYGGYVFEADNYAIKPTILTRFVYGAPIQIDMTANILLFRKAWLGLSYKTSSEMTFLLEYIIDNRFTVRYSYDYPFSSLNQVTNYGSHEVGIQFDFDFGKTVMKSIRYF